MMNEFPLEGYFYKFLSGTIFWYMLCCVHRGKSTKKRQQQHDENKIVEMRTTTTKRSLGNDSIRPHEMKFRSLEQNKEPKTIGKTRHKLETFDARRC
jgi:hypothetical protein